MVVMAMASAACGDAAETASCAAGTSDGWTDAAGCAVPAEVISLAPGDAACGWETVDFLTVGTPIGELMAASDARTYLWDPVNLLSYVDGDVRNRTVRTADLAAAVLDTGYRFGTIQLWSDPEIPAYVFLVDGPRANRFELDDGDPIVCA